MARPNTPFDGKGKGSSAYKGMPVSARKLLTRSKRVGLDGYLRPVNEGEISGETQWTTERKIQCRA